MSTRIQRRGGTTSAHSTFTGAAREITVDTNKNTAVVHDGVTAGGHPLAKSSELTDGLAGKANTLHTHSIANVTGLQAALDGKGVDLTVGQSLTAEEAGQARANLGANVLSGFRNKIIDGNFDFWNQATSQTSSGYGSSDMWRHVHNGSTKTVSRQAFALGQADVPGNPDYYCRTVVSSVAGAGNFCNQQISIEGVETLSGQDATQTLWMKADSAKDVAVEIYQYFGTGGSPSTPVSTVTTVSLTTAWQKLSALVSIPSGSGKTRGTNGDDAVYLVIWFDAGSDFNSRTNSLGQQSGTFDIARVSLVEGDATAEDDPFPAYDKGIELARVQRYYNTGLTIVPAAATNSYMTFFPVNMRAAPTVSGLGAGAVITAQINGFSAYQTSLSSQVYVADARL